MADLFEKFKNFFGFPNEEYDEYYDGDGDGDDNEAQEEKKPLTQVQARALLQTLIDETKTVDRNFQVSEGDLDAAAEEVAKAELFVSVLGKAQICYILSRP